MSAPERLKISDEFIQFLSATQNRVPPDSPEYIRADLYEQALRERDEARGIAAGFEKLANIQQNMLIRRRLLEPKPLTDDEASRLWTDAVRMAALPPNRSALLSYKDAIEAAHGITDAPPKE